MLCFKCRGQNVLHFPYLYAASMKWWAMHKVALSEYATTHAPTGGLSRAQAQDAEYAMRMSPKLALAHMFLHTPKGMLCGQRLVVGVPQAREVVDAMRADSGGELALLRADGGASRNGLLMQMQADALQVSSSSSRP